MELDRTIKRPILRYHGGKFLLAPWIISNMPSHHTYVELFSGAASILMRKARSACEIYNDKWDTVVNVFRVLRDPEAARELERRLRLTPYSRTEFMACTVANLAIEVDPIERARLTILRSFMGYGSASTNGAHATGFRTHEIAVAAWPTYTNQIAAFVERLRGVGIENLDYRELLTKHDKPSTLFYADPPYLHATRNMKRGNAYYAQEMSEQDHIDLAAALNNVQGMVLLSGYNSPLYTELFPGWEMLEKSTLADGARPRLECLWINKAASKQLSNDMI